MRPIRSLTPYHHISPHPPQVLYTCSWGYVGSATTAWDAVTGLGTPNFPIWKEYFNATTSYYCPPYHKRLSIWIILGICLLCLVFLFCCVQGCMYYFRVRRHRQRNLQEPLLRDGAEASFSL